MTWSYLPHTPEDRQAMLATVGAPSVEALFADLPEQVRLDRALALPAAMPEAVLTKHLGALAKANKSTNELICFLGAGAYDHLIPSVVDHVIRRSEFYTAYTQYQPEISQGYLQALWEYQSMICELTGMPVANASMYDGATAVAEAAMMACAASGRQQVVVAATMHPHYRAVLATYAMDKSIQVETAAYTDGALEAGTLSSLLTDKTATILVQYPNFFGCVEDVRALAEAAHAKGALVIVAADPVALGVLEAPGVLGADIVVGEGQSLGLPMAFGGPYLGFFAATEKLMRKMPGRIVGQTVDNRGNRGFVLTLQAREQHIRREKATSNICSNEALCALTAAVYLAAVGKHGFRKIAEQCLQKAHYAQRTLAGVKGCEIVFGKPFFQEFVVRFNKPVGVVNAVLAEQGILGGLDLGGYYPELAGCALLCVTEKRTKTEIDQLAAVLEAIV